MGYYVVGDDGRRYGPAELSQLQQWARERRIVPDTILEDAQTQNRLRAREVALIGFPQATSGTPVPPPIRDHVPVPARKTKVKATSTEKRWNWSNIIWFFVAMIIWQIIKHLLVQ